MNEIGLGVVVAGALYGFRHGFDLDHLAAISDITATSRDRRTALRLSLLYIAGHALVILVLGTVAIALGAYLPASLDAAMSRVVGLTLVALGLYLLYRIARDGTQVRLRSRWMLVADGMKAASRKLRRHEDVVVIEHDHEHVHEGSHDHVHGSPVPVGNGGGGSDGAVAVATHTHVHTHIATMPADPFAGYGRAAAVGVGMLHGVGAETPTQILLFASAAGAASTAGGFSVLVAFVTGLVAANSVVSAVAAGGMGSPRRWPRVYAAVALGTALFSLWMGTTYVLGG